VSVRLTYTVSLCLIILTKTPTTTHNTRSRGGQGRSSRGRSDSRGSGRAGGNHSSRAALTSEQKKIMSTVSEVKPNWSNNEVYRFCNKNGVCSCVCSACVRVGPFHPHIYLDPLPTIHSLTHSGFNQENVIKAIRSIFDSSPKRGEEQWHNVTVKQKKVCSVY
jgi:hypothetical protein